MKIKKIFIGRRPACVKTPRKQGGDCARCALCQQLFHLFCAKQSVALKLGGLIRQLDLGGIRLTKLSLERLHDVVCLDTVLSVIAVIRCSTKSIPCKSLNVHLHMNSS